MILCNQRCRVRSLHVKVKSGLRRYRRSPAHHLSTHNLSESRRWCLSIRLSSIGFINGTISPRAAVDFYTCFVLACCNDVAASVPGGNANLFLRCTVCVSSPPSPLSNRICRPTRCNRGNIRHRTYQRRKTYL